MASRLTADRLISKTQLKALLKEMAREKDAAVAAGDLKNCFVSDYFIVALTANLGCRISEIAALTWEDVHEDFVIIRRGKGGKRRDNTHTALVFPRFMNH